MDNEIIESLIFNDAFVKQINYTKSCLRECQLKHLDELITNYAKIIKRYKSDKTKKQKVNIVVAVHEELELYKEELEHEQNGDVLDISSLSHLNPRHPDNAGMYRIMDHSISNEN